MTLYNAINILQFHTLSDKSNVISNLIYFDLLKYNIDIQ